VEVCISSVIELDYKTCQWDQILNLHCFLVSDSFLFNALLSFFLFLSFSLSLSLSPTSSTYSLQVYRVIED